MKKLAYLILTGLMAGALIGCEEESEFIDAVPAAPQGVITITGDNSVDVLWDGPFEADIAEYVIWRSEDNDQNFEPIASLEVDPNPDLALIPYIWTDSSADNGKTYWYAVQSVDLAGQESNLSVPTFDTPRPADKAVVFPNHIDPTQAGFNFETRQPVPWNGPAAHVFVDVFEGVYYVNLGDAGALLQDMGWTGSFEDIGYGTEFGWSELGFSELIPGHTYMIVTTDNNWAKIRITAINDTQSVSFEWAWQSVPGNLELAAPVDSNDGDGRIRTRKGLHLK